MSEPRIRLGQISPSTSGTDSISGNVAITGTVNVATANISTIVAGGALTLSTGAGSNGNVIISANNAEDMRITPAGDVGIGTTVPLTVTGSTYTWRVGQLYSANDAAFIINGNGGAGRLHLVGGTASANQKSFGLESFGGSLIVTSILDNLGTTERLRINSSGNVGVGTSNPAVRLHLESDGTSGAFGEMFRVRGGPDANDTGASIGIFQKDNSRGLIIRAGRGTGDQAKADFILNQSGLAIPSATQSTIMTLLQSGNVGIGTTSPQTLLDARGNAFFGNNGSDGLLKIRGFNNANSTFSVNAGASSNYNGFLIQSNENNNNSLPSWWVDIGGIDNISRSGTSDTFNVARKPSGGSVTTHFLINSSGHTLIPNQPAFTAWSTLGWTDFSSGTVIVFNGTRFNTGSHYNTSNGRFTAPTTGRYFFTGTFFRENATAITYTVNGSQLGSGDVVPYSFADPGFLLTITTAIILNLNAGDFVEVRVRAGYSARLYMGHSHFSGHLIG